MPTYRIFASNPTNFDLYGEIPFSTLDFSDVLNAAGNISITVPLLDSTILPASHVTPGSTALWVERDGVLVWGGVLWTVDVDLIGQTINMSGEGWLSYYSHRILTSNFDTGQFSAGTAGADVTLTMWYLLRVAHEEMPGIPAWGYPYPPRSNVPNIDTTAWIISALNGGVGWTPVGAVLASDVTNIGTMIQEVCSGTFATSALDDVPIQTLDYWIEPVWDTANNRPSCAWKFVNNRRGSALAKPLSLTAGVLSLNVTYDAVKMANQVSVLGDGEGDMAPSGSASVVPTGLFLQTAFSRQLVNPVSCANFAQDAVAALSKVHVIPQVSLLGENPAWEYQSYNVGDTFVIGVSQGFIDLASTPWRITEKATSVDASGTEVVTLTVADSVLYE